MSQGRFFVNAGMIDKRFMLRGAGMLPRPRSTHSVENRIGRNDPCSCGSGRKFKKCCHQVNLKRQLIKDMETLKNARDQEAKQSKEASQEGFQAEGQAHTCEDKDCHKDHGEAESQDRPVLGSDQAQA